MVLDIKMCRFDNVPWGFRLVGGADYDYPLTVVKVRPDSKKERNLYAATPTPHASPQPIHLADVHRPVENIAHYAADESHWINSIRYVRISFICSIAILRNAAMRVCPFGFAALAN